MFIDVGKEICTQTGRLWHQAIGPNEQAQVYKWRRCCLESYMKWMYDGSPPSDKGAGQRYYHDCMLRDIAALTSVAPKRSSWGRGGLLYSQFYSSAKEMFDATKRFPFDNDGLEELALNAAVARSIHGVAGGYRRQQEVLIKGYLASKRRVATAIKDSQQKSFGIREEHRIRWELMLELLLRIERQEDPPAVTLPTAPPYVYAIRTPVLLEFLQKTTDKYATGFEITRATAGQQVSWSHTQAMAMFLRCLPFVVSGQNLTKETAVWWGHRQSSREAVVQGRDRFLPATREIYGLGFVNTLRKYGFCWLEPRFDWERWTFQPQFADHVLFGNNMLRNQYNRYGQRIYAVFDATRKIELALRWIAEYHTQQTVVSRMIHWMSHTVLHQFRLDVIGSGPVDQEIVPEEADDAKACTAPWSFDYFFRIFGEVHLVEGGKTMLKQPELLYDLFFGDEPDLRRKHWDTKPFRMLYHQARAGLVPLRIGIRADNMWKEYTKKIFFRHHWILPYPGNGMLTQTTKQSKRMWYSVIIERDKHIWGKDTYRTGTPRALPEYISWDKNQWLEYLEPFGGAGDGR